MLNSIKVDVLVPKNTHLLKNTHVHLIYLLCIDLLQYCDKTHDKNNPIVKPLYAKLHTLLM